MTFWVIVLAVVVVGSALTRWAGRRREPGIRHRSLTTEMQIRDGRDHGRNTTYGPY